MIKKIFFGINLLLLGSGMYAQKILRLPDAVNMALQSSLDIQLAQNHIAQDSINNNKGVAGGLPLLTANIADNEQVSSVNQKLNSGANINRNNAASNALSAGITGSILLYNGGRVVASKKRLAQLETQSRQLLTSQVQEVIASVMIGYYDIVRQQEYLKTIDRSIDASNQQLQMIKVRQSVGLANNADLFQAQIDLSNLQQAKLAQQLVISQAKTELLRMLTANPDSSIEIKDSIEVDKNIMLADILNGLSNNPDIIAADNQIKISEYIVKETEALRYPSIRATTGYNFIRNKTAAGNILLNQNYGPTVGLSIGIPIYNGSVYKRQKQVAQLDVQNAGLQKQILIRDYNANAVKQYQAYTISIHQLDSAVAAYGIAEKLLQLTLMRFDLRQATIVEVRNAQQSFEESGYRLVNINFSAKTAEIALKRMANLLKL